MEDGIERKIIVEMCSRLVASSDEIVNFVNREKEVPTSVIKSVTKSLVERGMLRKVYTSTTSFAITKKGMRSFR